VALLGCEKVEEAGIGFSKSFGLGRKRGNGIASMTHIWRGMGKI
jgi:hypothetical protein